MADREAARKTGEARVISLTPDVCLTPVGPSMVPVPYPIVGTFNTVSGEKTTVRFAGKPAFTTESRVTKVVGDEAGTGGGVVSGASKGQCKPLTFSTTVRASTQNLLHHGSQMEMNCLGSGGTGNTIGSITYLKITTRVSVGADGSIEGDTNPPVKPETKNERRWWDKAWSWTREKVVKYKLLQRADGVVDAGFAAVDMVSGVGEILLANPVTTPLGVVTLLHGVDEAGAAVAQIATGKFTSTLTQKVITKGASRFGASRSTANVIGEIGDLAVGLSPGAVIKKGLKKKVFHLLKGAGKFTWDQAAEHAGKKLSDGAQDPKQGEGAAKKKDRGSRKGASAGIKAATGVKITAVAAVAGGAVAAVAGGACTLPAQQQSAAKIPATSVELPPRSIIAQDQKISIAWDKVVVMGEPGALELEPYVWYSKKRKVNQFVLHWDVAFSSRGCRDSLENQGLSVHFMIDNDGTIYQAVDMNHACAHAGTVNMVSVGVEISNRVLLSGQDHYVRKGFGPRPVVTPPRINGGVHATSMLDFYPVQIDAAVALARAVTSHYDIPLVAPETMGLHQTTHKALRRYRGIVAHYHVDLDRGKWDTACLPPGKLIKRM